MENQDRSSQPPRRMLFFSRWLYYLSSIPTLFLGIRNWQTMLKVFLGVAVAQPVLIELKNGLRFQVRTRMDIWVLKKDSIEFFVPARPTQ